MKTAIVLSGGGSKGAYEVGVWEALSKLHISYDIVTGTSVGALNGAFMVQNDLKTAKWMWENINFNMIFSNFDINYHTKEGKKKLLQHYVEGILFKGGVDVTALEETIKTYIKEQDFYQSKIDYGLVTIDFTNLKPLELSKKEIPKEHLCDYLMASATCFPAFQKKKIGNKEFIDGGYYDNLPLNLAVRLGAEKIIAVNIGSIDIMKPLVNSKIDVILIEPYHDLGSFLVFEKEQSKRMMKLGYNDAMKKFGKLDGNLFTFKKNEIRKYTKKYYNKLVYLLKKWVDTSKITFENSFYFQFINETNQRVKEQMMLEILEDLASRFEFEEVEVYQLKCFNKKLLEIIRKKRNLNGNLFSGILKKESRAKEIPLMFYYKMTSKTKNNNFKEIPYMYLFQKEFAEALYLTLLK